MNKKIMGILAALFVTMAAYAGPPDHKGGKKPVGSVNKPVESVNGKDKDKSKDKVKGSDRDKVKDKKKDNKGGLKKGWFKNTHNPHHPQSDNPGHTKNGKTKPASGQSGQGQTGTSQPGHGKG